MMSKKLLFQLDTDAIANSFDTIVGYDGGADHVIPHGGVNPQNVGMLVDGSMFARSPREKQFSAIFVGGSKLAEGQALFEAIKKKFFANFRVSVMLDSNGSNTTAAAGVAYLIKHCLAAGKRAVVLAGTGPVGQRAAAILAREGAEVVITSRVLARAQAACKLIKERFGYDCIPVAAVDDASRGKALAGARIVYAAGAAGVQLLCETDWMDNPTLEVICDANATPVLGVQGIDMTDKAVERHGKIVYGALGIGDLKMKLHRQCIARLFEQNDLLLDAEDIYGIAKTMV